MLLFNFEDMNGQGCAQPFKHFSTRVRECLSHNLIMVTICIIKMTTVTISIIKINKICLNFLQSYLNNICFSGSDKRF